MHFRLLLLLLLGMSTALAETPKVTSLKQAIERVRENSPLIQGSKYRVQVQEALMEQAGFLPNPELVIEAENFGGDFERYRQAETTIGVTQRIELGGKRAARSSVATTKQKIAELEAKILALNLLSETTISFARLQSTISKRKILAEQKKLSRSVVRNIQRKLEAGSVLSVERTKAEIAFKNDEIAFKNIDNEIEIVKQNLASLWGGTAEDLGRITSSLSVSNVELYLIAHVISETPRSKLAELKYELAKETLHLEESLATPDLNIGLGYRRFEETEDNAFLGMLSIDLPLFDRNQGGIKGADYNLSAQRMNKESNNLSLMTTLNALQINLRRLINEYHGVEQSVLPSAKSAFTQAKNAYQRGRTSYLELLDAQRTLVETKTRRLDLMLTIEESKARINNIIEIPQHNE